MSETDSAIGRLIACSKSGHTAPATLDREAEAELERMHAAEEVCYRILIHMSFGCDADTILRGCDELQTWANLAARDGKLREDDPEGKEVSHAVPYPDGPVLEGYPA